MKKILITGANSYIGTSFEKYMQQFGEEYQIDTISLKDESWKVKDFSKYDSLIHLAAIVHQKETNEKIYYDVNRDLAIEIAEKSKNEGIQQFIFFSTMAVFGVENGIITNETPLNPKNAYGKSKLEAEKLIYNQRTKEFKVAVLRPPMIYGPDCAGNYPKLAKLARTTPIFPKLINKRSMLFVGNLHSLLKKLVDEGSGGFYHPQNNEYVNVSDLVRTIADVNNHRIIIIPGFNRALMLLSKVLPTLKKISASLYYNISLSKNIKDLNLNDRKSFYESIRETEGLYK